MQFMFKRDEEGRERIYVGDVLVAGIDGRRPLLAYAVAGVTYRHLEDAIERADEAGFWQRRSPLMDGAASYRRRETTVDVPVAETTSTILSLTTEGDKA